MDTRSLRDQLSRHERLDEDWFHLFSLASMVDSLRSEPEYEANGHTGVALLKSSTLRAVLGVAKKGSRIGEHTVRGPTMIHVIEGSLCMTALDETRIAHAGEMVVVPHDRPRELVAESDTTFLLILALDAPS